MVRGLVRLCELPGVDKLRTQAPRHQKVSVCHRAAFILDGPFHMRRGERVRAKITIATSRGKKVFPKKTQSRLGNRTEVVFSGRHLLVNEGGKDGVCVNPGVRRPERSGKSPVFATHCHLNHCLGRRPRAPPSSASTKCRPVAPAFRIKNPDSARQSSPPTCANRGVKGLPLSNAKLHRLARSDQETNFRGTSRESSRFPSR